MAPPAPPIAPAPAAPVAPPPPPPIAAAPAYEPYLLTPPPVAPMPELLAGPPPRRGRSVAVAAGVVAVLGVAGVATALALNSGGVSGGASSPEAAVVQGADAVAAQNVDRLFQYVDPAEARPLHALFDATRSALAKDSLITASGIPEPWLHVRVADLRVASAPSGGNVAYVSLVDGTASATVDESGIPDQLRPSRPRTRTATATAGRLNDRMTVHGAPPVVAVVKVSGRWFLSPTTTILETVRRNLRLDAPDFTHVAEVGPGAKDPRSVLTDFAAAMQAQDVRAGAALVSQQEVPALSAYYPVFAAELGDGLQRTGGQVDGVDSSAQNMSDGLVKVTVNAASASNAGNSARYSGGCLLRDGRRPRCINGTFTRETGLDAPFVVVGHENGGWRIRPVATVMEYLRTIMTDGSRNAVYRYEFVPWAAPVTSTIHADIGQEVKLNDAAFAHIRLEASPGTCFTDVGDDEKYWVEWRADERDDPANDGYCYVVPSSGVVDGVVWAGSSQASTTVALNLRGR